MSWWTRGEPQWVYTFEAGDLVQLKSGGPVMTVAFEVSPEASSWTGANIGVHCSWFVDEVAHTVVFWPNQLERVKNKGRPEHDDITAPWETSAICEQQIQAIVDNADRQNKERGDGGPLLGTAMADMFKVIARHLDAQTTDPGVNG